MGLIPRGITFLEPVVTGMFVEIPEFTSIVVDEFTDLITTSEL